MLAIVRSRREAEATIKVRSRAHTQPGSPDPTNDQAFHCSFSSSLAHSIKGDVLQGS